MQKVIYVYKALDSKNEVVLGDVEASSSREARKKIRELGYTPIELCKESEEGIVSPTELAKNKTSMRSNVSWLSLNEKIFLTSELQILLSTSIPVTEALDSIERHSPSYKIRYIVGTMKEEITNGKSFTEALNQFYDVFGPVFVGLCYAGEAAGELDETLDRILFIYKNQKKVKSKIISASILPLANLVIMVGVLAFLSARFFPAYIQMYKYMNIDIPIQTQSLLDFLCFMGSSWQMVVIFAVGIIYSTITILKTERFKRFWDGFLCGIPLIKDFVSYLNLSNFMAVLQVAYDAGVDIIKAVELSKETMTSYLAIGKAEYSISLLRTGATLTHAFSRADLLDGTMLSLVSSGEKSGSLGDMLKECTDYIDQRIHAIADTLAQLAGPVFTVIIGVTVGFVAVAFWLMYYKALGSMF